MIEKEPTLLDVVESINKYASATNARLEKLEQLADYTAKGLRVLSDRGRKRRDELECRVDEMEPDVKDMQLLVKYLIDTAVVLGEDGVVQRACSYPVEES